MGAYLYTAWIATKNSPKKFTLFSKLSTVFI